MSDARKPVIVRKLSRDWCAGYVAGNLAGEESALELLDKSGKLLQIEWSQVKWVCYVREPAGELFPVPARREAWGRNWSQDLANPERLLRRRFSARPRVAGLWLRLLLSDGDELEGVAANDRSLIEGSGLLLTPPDTRSNTQRVFVPRGAIRELTVLGVVSPSAAQRNRSAQPELFASEQDSGA